MATAGSIRRGLGRGGIGSYVLAKPLALKCGGGGWTRQTTALVFDYSGRGREYKRRGRERAGKGREAKGRGVRERWGGRVVLGSGGEGRGKEVEGERGRRDAREREWDPDSRTLYCPLAQHGRNLLKNTQETFTFTFTFTLST